MVYVYVSAALAALAVLVAGWYLASCRAKRSMVGEHVVVTGGSQGLGLALAVACVRRGANVTIIARNAAALDAALTACSAEAAPGARALAAAGDVTNELSVLQAVKLGEASFGPVDVLIACAGCATTGMFLDLDDATFVKQTDLNYLGVVRSVRAVAGGMVARGSGRLVLVSSGLALCGYAGYAAYAPTKWAVRGLCEVLRSELGPRGVAVHSVYPPNMDTPGFAVENRSKPAATKAIEEGEPTHDPAAIARSILASVDAGDYQICCGDFGISLLARAANGLAPRTTLAFDVCALPLIAIIGAVYRRVWEHTVRRSYASMKQDS
ncbi:hypothetical protein M885DRAFT_552716 [Pelagophyceae sp. CCMP2097]|nr:hypothetical protein M885DRAFT_552716 [Pelagophyceae sp. CCMP2097]|mmetsp:Transcript_25947/g.92585  ORF Transcript_25947/g.92585 Transcript_25947/m.92585 type:complete len:324 (-) Transcript_25947:96-1067(-)